MSAAAPRYRALIATATELFSEQGFEPTTIRQIAERLGVKSASLYSHVGSKAEILREIVLDVAHAFTDSALTASSDADTRLRALCRTHMRIMNDRHAAVVVYFHYWRKLSAVHQEEIKALRREYEDLFHAAIAEGDHRQGLDVRATTRVLLGALNWTYEWRTPDHGPSPEATADAILDTLLQGMHA